MGVDKATIVYRGETLAARAARVLSEVCDPVLEVGPGYTVLRAVREDPPGGGPLAALVAGAAALATREAVLLLACDMPFVEAALLQFLAAQPGSCSVVPTRAGREQYGCARYSTQWIDAATANLQRGIASFTSVTDPDRELVAESAWRTVAPPNALDDVDTPGDRARSIGREATEEPTEE